VLAETDSLPLTGTVDFYLHPTFSPSVRTVAVENQSAALHVTAYRAFTVGAVADDGRTKLELDLSADTSFPEKFREP
jgi:hypothetical protein